jgi:large subunit ribosomal protein L23
MKTAYDVIIRPIITEQSMEDLDIKKYAFEVAKDANKIEIKKALETVFPNIKVKSVNTLRTEGKIKRQGIHAGRTPEVKKAYVTLTEDSKPIEFFEGMM